VSSSSGTRDVRGTLRPLRTSGSEVLVHPGDGGSETGAAPFHRRGRPALMALLTAALLLALPTAASTHEIPPSVTVIAFVKPEGNVMRLVVRVPLESIRDVEFPLRDSVYLDLRALEPLLADAAQLWLAGYVRLYEDDTALGEARIVATRIALPSDRSFETYESAAAGVVAPPLPADTELPWQQALLDVMLEYPIASDSSRFSIHPAWAHLGITTTTVLRFLPPSADGGERVFRYEGDPGLVRLDPRWHQAALRFVALGFEHILDGLDHLLFVFCLVIPFRRLRPLILVVTSFTVAHSITLIASAFGFAPGALWFPPLIETLIALSIVWMALENIVGPKLERRWVIAFGFGLVHGFGFSFLLRESMQFAGSHLVSSLLAFNLGVELGQVFVIALAIPVLTFLFRRVVAERMGTIILSALVAHTAWHWMGERFADFRAYEIQAPAFDLLLLASVMRVAMLALIIAGAAWGLYEVSRRWARGQAGLSAE
jgi:hypothetical protein